MDRIHEEDAQAREEALKRRKRVNGVDDPEQDADALLVAQLKEDGHGLGAFHEEVRQDWLKRQAKVDESKKKR